MNSHKKKLCPDCGGLCDDRAIRCKHCVSFKGALNPRFGKKLSDVTKKKISEKALIRLADKTKHPLYGKYPSEKARQVIIKYNEIHGPWNKGLKGVQVSYKKGKTLEEIYGVEKAVELKRIMSKKMSGRPSWRKDKTHLSHPESIPAGENHCRWVGGKSFEPYTSDFSRAFKQLIRERDDFACVVCNFFSESLPVHHIDYDKTNSIPQNCVSLCRSCHSKTNINRAHWKIFFQNVLKERFNYEYENNIPVIDLCNIMLI